MDRLQAERIGSGLDTGFRVAANAVQRSVQEAQATQRSVPCVSSLEWYGFFPVDIAEEERRLQPTPFMQHLETNRGHLMRSAGTKGMVLHWFEMGEEIWLFQCK